MVIITGHKKHFLPKYRNRPSPHDTCGGRAPPTLRFSLQKKNVHLFQSSISVSCCAWPREQPEHDTEKLLVHLTDSAGPAQQNPAPLELLHLTCCRARGCCETGWASLTNQSLGPPWGTAESSIWHHSQGCWGAALSEVTVGQEQPCTEPSTGTLQWLCSWTSREKLTLGSHWLLHTLWQCHLPAGAAGTFRMHQLLRKTSRDVNGSGEKINAESNSKDLIHLMAIKPERFSLGKHQPSVISTRDKLPSSHLAKGKEGLLRSPLLWRKLNSSPVGPEVWVAGTFSATKALTPRETTKCEKATLKRKKKKTILLPN